MGILRSLLGQIAGKREVAPDLSTADSSGRQMSVGEFLGTQGISPAFNLLDVGAVPIDGQDDVFPRLLTMFPGSRLSAIEIDPVLCEELNRKASANVRYYPCALGRASEARTLYLTANPLCTSLYPPDERFADRFQNLSDMRAAGTSSITTISLAEFVRRHRLGDIDFLKMDVQGAELEVLQGGARVLDQLLMVVSEVEFVPLYKEQPLFGDVDAFLRSRGFMLHKLLGMAGRVMKPLKFQGSANYPVQHLWSDALFVRDLLALEALASEQLLKLAVLLDLYDSKDAALHLLSEYDTRVGSTLAAGFLAALNRTGPWGITT